MDDVVERRRRPQGRVVVQIQSDDEHLLRGVPHSYRMHTATWRLPGSGSSRAAEEEDRNDLSSTTACVRRILSRPPCVLQTRGAPRGEGEGERRGAKGLGGRGDGSHGMEMMGWEKEEGVPIYL